MFCSPSPRSQTPAAVSDEIDNSRQGISGVATPVFVAGGATLDVISHASCHKPQQSRFAKPLRQQSRTQLPPETQVGTELAAAYDLENDTASVSPSTDGAEVLPSEELIYRNKKLAKLKPKHKIVHTGHPQWLPVVPRCSSKKNTDQQDSMVWIPCVPGLTFRQWALYLGPLRVPRILQ